MPSEILQLPLQMGVCWEEGGGGGGWLCNFHGPGIFSKIS